MTASTDAGAARWARLKDLPAAGVSVWLDDLSRSRLSSGSLREQVEHAGVTGVTTNPSIFAASISTDPAYGELFDSLRAVGATVDEAIRSLTVADVRDACDVLAQTHIDTGGADGFVSLEVDPLLCRDSVATVNQAVELNRQVDRQNLMIKIPATRECLPAVTECLAAGISVNVTLIFSPERYQQVQHAHLEGMQRAAQRGLDVASIQSVASFFVSRIDTEVDRRLGELGRLEFRGLAALSQARVAYFHHNDSAISSGFDRLRSAGACRQRLLWASTGVKDQSYRDTRYVAELALPGTVDTIPEATLLAYCDHGEIPDQFAVPDVGTALANLEDIARAGVDLADVAACLEEEGIAKFQDAWRELQATVRERLAGSAPATEAGTR